MNPTRDTLAYGLWTLVVIDSTVFIFLYSLARPQSERDWRSLLAAYRPAHCRGCLTSCPPTLNGGVP